MQNFLRFTHFNKTFFFSFQTQYQFTKTVKKTAAIENAAPITKTVLDSKLKNFTVIKGLLIPHPPKRPANTYALYLKEKFSNKTGLSVTEMSKTFSVAYKNDTLDTDLKQKLKKQAEDAKKDYELAFSKYKEQFQVARANISPYSIFVKDVYSKTKSANEKASESMKKIAEKWKALDENGKKPYQDSAVKNKEEYQKKLVKLESLYKIPIIAKSNSFSQYLKSYTYSNKDNTRRQNAAAEWKLLDEKAKEKFKLDSEASYKKQQGDYEAFAKRFGLSVEELDQIVTKSQKATDKVKQKKKDKTFSQ